LPGFAGALLNEEKSISYVTNINGIMTTRDERTASQTELNDIDAFVAVRGLNSDRLALKDDRSALKEKVRLLKHEH
jgi:hypothetical protein